MQRDTPLLQILLLVLLVLSAAFAIDAQRWGLLGIPTKLLTLASKWVTVGHSHKRRGRAPVFFFLLLISLTRLIVTINIIVRQLVIFHA